MKRLEAIVHGRVQGVFFRHYTQMTARTLALTGWVRNEFDGTVQVVAEGPEDALQSLLAFLQQGSPQAQIDRVETQWLPARHEFSVFETRR
jgi:acylphosphatase